MDDDGSIVEVASAGYPMDSPRPGWAETDPAAWWAAVQREVSSLAPSNLREIEGIGLAGQMHGVVMADGEGWPLRPAILWADGRSVDEVERFRRLNPSQLRRLGNPLATGMAGPTLLWLKWQEPQLYQSARRALQPKERVRLELPGEAFGGAARAAATP